MSTEFSQEELNNLLALISRVQITGKEAVVVVLLQQKIAKLLQAMTPEPSREPAPKVPKF